MTWRHQPPYTDQKALLIASGTEGETEKVVDGTRYPDLGRRSRDVTLYRTQSDAYIVFVRDPREGMYIAELTHDQAIEEYSRLSDHVVEFTEAFPASTA